MNKSETKEEQKLLEKTAEIYQSITRDSMDGFLIVDIKGQILDVNDSYSKLIGYSRSELLKMNLCDIEAGEKTNCMTEHLQRIRRTGEDRFSNQHRKKNGEIINIEASANFANYLGGLIFIFIRDVSKRKKAEDDLAINRAQSKDIVEKELAESYTHLGLINRKISLLLELENSTRSKKDQQKTIDHILNLAMNISNAPTGYLYGLKRRGKYDLLSYKGIEENQKEKIRVVTAKTIGLLRHLIKEKGLISGDIKQYEAELLALDNKLEYFVTLPLSKGKGLGGFIFLGFDKQMSVDAQDLEFLDVFAMHATNALIKAGVLK